MRLIDADAVEKALWEFRATHKYIQERCAIVGCVLEIREQPTIDAVPVVRCKDCKYFEMDEDGLDVLGVCKCGKIAVSYNGEIYPKETDFCSYGERKE